MSATAVSLRPSVHRLRVLGLTQAVAVLVTATTRGPRGFCYQVVATASLPYFKDYMGVSTEVYQAMTTVAWTPWSLKPLVGILSDVVPIRGYHKRWYVRPSPAGR